MTSQHRDVATLKANVATLQRKLKMHIKEPWSKIREKSPHIIANLKTFVMCYINGLSPVLSIAGPEIIRPKRDIDYGQNIKSKQLKANNVNHRKENCTKNLVAS